MSLSGALPLDPRAFLMDENVRMMTEREAWCYLRLLMHQWEEGSIPNCPVRLSAILTEGPRRVTREDLVGAPEVDGVPDSRSGSKRCLEAPLERSLWHSLKRCFSVAYDDPERLINARLHRDREEWIAKKKRYRSAGRKGGRASSKVRETKASDDTSDAPTIVERSLEVTPKRSSTRSRSRSRSRSEGERRDPPLPPSLESVAARSETQISAMRGKSSRQKGRKTPRVEIPAELAGVIDFESFVERVATCVKVKPVAAWQKELDRLAPLVAECDPDAVRETWQDAIAGGWQGCTPEMVRERASRAKRRRGGGGRKPVGLHAAKLFSRKPNG